MNVPAAARDFLAAMERRYACKLYDGARLSPEIEAYILECGRLSPSSFGLEPWTFIANHPGGPVREAMFEACFAQDAVKTAGLVVAILVRRAASYDPDSAFVLERAERFPGGHPVFRADYIGYWQFLKDEGRLEEWARAQTYIAAANMMTGAAFAGVDSCAIEGYKEESILSALDADPSSWRVGLVAVFGRKAEERREKIRTSASALIQYRD